MRLYLLVIAVWICGFRAAAQDKILVAGSGNPFVQLVHKQTGKVEWQHALEQGEECNTVALTNEGNVLYSYKRGAKVVTWDHRVIWDYQVSGKAELQSATLLRNGGILLGICGNPAEFIELDKDGREINKTKIDLGIDKPHSQFRQIFQLKNKNYLIPVMAKQKIMEINRKGRLVAEYDITGKAFSSLELTDGNLLLPCGDNHCYIIVDRYTGKELKRVTSDDIKGASLWFVAQILELKNKNLLICNWGGHTKGIIVDVPQLIEIDKDGNVVWTLNNKQDIDKVSTACYLEGFHLPDLK